MYALTALPYPRVSPRPALTYIHHTPVHPLPQYAPLMRVCLSPLSGRAQYQCRSSPTILPLVNLAALPSPLTSSRPPSRHAKHAHLTTTKTGKAANQRSTQSACAVLGGGGRGMIVCTGDLHSLTLDQRMVSEERGVEVRGVHAWGGS